MVENNQPNNTELNIRRSIDLYLSRLQLVYFRKMCLGALGIYHVAALVACEDHQLVNPISLSELAPSSCRIVCCKDIPK